MTVRMDARSCLYGSACISSANKSASAAATVRGDDVFVASGRNRVFGGASAIDNSGRVVESDETSWEATLPLEVRRGGWKRFGRASVRIHDERRGSM